MFDCLYVLRFVCSTVGMFCMFYCFYVHRFVFSTVCILCVLYVLFLVGFTFVYSTFCMFYVCMSYSLYVLRFVCNTFVCSIFCLFFSHSLRLFFPDCPTCAQYQAMEMKMQEMFNLYQNLSQKVSATKAKGERKIFLVYIAIFLKMVYNSILTHVYHPPPHSPPSLSHPTLPPPWCKFFHYSNIYN